MCDRSYITRSDIESSPTSYESNYSTAWIAQEIQPDHEGRLAQQHDLSRLTTQTYLLKQDSAPTLVLVENDALVPLLDLVLAECERRLTSDMAKAMDPPTPE
jgi:hypothetical protein